MAFLYRPVLIFANNYLSWMKISQLIAHIKTNDSKLKNCVVNPEIRKMLIYFIKANSIYETWLVYTLQESQRKLFTFKDYLPRKEQISGLILFQSRSQSFFHSLTREETLASIIENKKWRISFDEDFSLFCSMV